MHRTAWDLRYQSKNPIDPDEQQSSDNPWQAWRRGGAMAVPGTYAVSLLREVDGQLTTLSGPVNFEIVPLRDGALEGKSYAEIDAYRKTLEDIAASVSAVEIVMEESADRIGAMRTALARTDTESPELVSQLFSLKNTLTDLDIRINGNKVKAEIGALDGPTIDDRVGTARRGLSTTYGPTAMHQENLEIAKAELQEIEKSLDQITKIEIPKIERALQASGAPWIVGQVLPKS
jgi:hypothetical protein